MPKKKTTAELEQSAPAIPAVEALRRNLLYRVMQRLGAKSGSLDTIVDKMMEKAEGGDLKAAKLVFDMLRAGTDQQRGPVYMQQMVSNTTFLSDMRSNLVRLLAAFGPMTADRAASTLGVPTVRVAAALEHAWFEREPDGYHITPQARAEVLEALEG